MLITEMPGDFINRTASIPLSFVVALPPPIPNITENQKGHSSQVKNAAVQRFGGPFAHLLRSFIANRTLRKYRVVIAHKKKKYCYEQIFFHPG